jgi:predicted Zn-dependent protease
MSLGPHSYAPVSSPQIQAGLVKQPSPQAPFERSGAIQGGRLPDRFVRQGVRWPIEAFPLKVYISHYENDISPDGLSNNQISLWVDAWTKASQGVMTWQLTDDIDHADIAVLWADRTVLGRDFEVGHANRDVSGEGLLRAVEITLLKSPAIDAYLNPKQIQSRWQATILHEFGHALGLEHSPNPQDVMFHQGWKNTKLTQGDIQQLMTLYSLKSI